MKLEHFLYFLYTDNWIRGLNVRPDNIKLLEGNSSKTLFDINSSKICYDPVPKEMENVIKNKWKNKSNGM